MAGDDDDDNDDWEPSPYQPLYPFREGFTVGVCFTLVLGIIVWLVMQLF